MKQVMKVEMYGQIYAVYQKPGVQYEFKVYRPLAGRQKIYLDEFESFQEAMEYVVRKLYAD